MMPQTTQTPADHIIKIILAHCATRNDVKRAIALARDFYEYRFFEQGNQALDSNIVSSYVSLKSIRAEDVPLLQSLIAGQSAITATSLYPILDQVSEAIDSLPVITLYIPVELDTASMTSIATWLRSVIHPSLLISVVIDPAYVGGCGIGWNGTFKDYSYRQLADKQLSVIQQILHETSSDIPTA